MKSSASISIVFFLKIDIMSGVLIIKSGDVVYLSYIFPDDF